MFSWLRGREATIDELREQLTGARERHQAALVEAEHAQAAFDTLGDEGSARALLAAREAAELAGMHVARAERLQAAAQQRVEEQRVAVLRAELESIRAKLTYEAAQEAGKPLTDRLVALLRQVAEVQVQRRDLARRHRALADRGEILARELGVTLPGGLIAADGRVCSAGHLDDHAALLEGWPHEALKDAVIARELRGLSKSLVR